MKLQDFAEKNEKMTILIIIFSYEAVKYQKVSVYIMKGLFFDFPRNTTALPVTPRVAFFFDPEN